MTRRFLLFLGMLSPLFGASASTFETLMYREPIFIKDLEETSMQVAQSHGFALRFRKTIYRNVVDESGRRLIETRQLGFIKLVSFREMVIPISFTMSFNPNRHLVSEEQYPNYVKERISCSYGDWFDAQYLPELINSRHLDDSLLFSKMTYATCAEIHRKLAILSGDNFE